MVARRQRTSLIPGIAETATSTSKGKPLPFDASMTTRSRSSDASTRIARFVAPFDWSPDGRSILATSSLSGPPHYSLTLWPLAAAPHAETAVKVLATDADYDLWQGKFSPDGRWICFEAVKTDEPGTTTIFVMPSGGADRSHWTALTAGHEWADKPRWSPDGKLVYFLLQRGSFFNLWAVHFDGGQGKAIGAPFQITRFDSLRRQIGPQLHRRKSGCRRSG